MRAIILLTFTSFTISMWGAILTVDNNNPSSSQYTTLQACHDAAANGDTIYVVPSNANYQSLGCTKALTIIGTGWNPNGLDGYMIKSTNISSSANVVFHAGSEYSTIAGFGGQFSVIIYTSNITINHCYLKKLMLGGSSYTVNELLVKNNIISHIEEPIKINRSDANYSCFFINNIVVTEGTNFIDNYAYGNQALNAYCTFINNTFKSTTIGAFLGGGDSYYQNATFKNNIITSNIVVDASITYNITGTAAASCISANYHTIPGTAAIDAGDPNPSFNDLDGSRNDCGAYGGPTSFVDGGIPGYPAIYEINGPGVATPNETIEVQIKAKTKRD